MSNPESEPKSLTQILAESIKAELEQKKTRESYSELDELLYFVDSFDPNKE